MFKYFLFVFIFLSLIVSADSFFPENDLWKEDRLFEASGISEELFNNIIDLAHKEYRPFAEEYNETLIINKLWDDPTVNANVSRFWGTVTINMYGGLARRPEINAEGFTLVVCHELGHAYGGKPYIQPWSKLSAEGQADYYSTNACAKKVFAKLNLETEVETTLYTEKMCEEDNVCLRSLSGGFSLALLLSVISSGDVPSYDTPDPNVVKKTILSYPSLQCRLDSYHNGALDMDRPLCWYKPKD